MEVDGAADRKTETFRFAPPRRWFGRTPNEPGYAIADCGRKFEHALASAETILACAVCRRAWALRRIRRRGFSWIDCVCSQPFLSREILPDLQRQHPHASESVGAARHSRAGDWRGCCGVAGQKLCAQSQGPWCFRSHGCGLLSSWKNPPGGGAHQIARVRVDHWQRRFRGPRRADHASRSVFWFDHRTNAARSNVAARHAHRRRRQPRNRGRFYDAPSAACCLS